MALSFKSYKHTFFAIVFAGFCVLCHSQVDTTTLKAQIALGVNSPSSNGFVSNFESKSINFPTVNLGLQYMLSPTIGAKLDVGFNRFSNINNTPEFKVNYSRLNVQLVYNTKRLFEILPNNMAIFVHAGPGFSIIKPLGNYPENKNSYLNIMGGIEFHYGLNDTFSVFIDGSYISGFSKEFNPISNGFGSFNGDLLNISIGVSLSLTGCYYCNHE
jgi:hypothetical protein